MIICRKIWKYLIFGVLVYMLIILKTDYFPNPSTYYSLLNFQFFENISNGSSSEQLDHLAQFKDINYTFHFLRTPKGRGKCDSNTTVLLIVLSVADHFDIRKTIRSTYASSNNSEKIEEKTVRVNFIFSMPTETKTILELNKEVEIYDDLIVTDLPETYENLILKVYSLLTYKHQYCDDVDYVVKIDEDFVIDIDLMYFRFTENPMLANPNSLSCWVWKKSLPKRDRKNKWYVPRTFWPAKYYPNYCDGPMYMIGKKPIPKMLEEAKNHKKWILEDVFWTGIVPQKYNVPRINWSQFLLRYEEDLNSNKRMKCSLKKPMFFGCHGLKGPEKIAQGFAWLKNVTC